jgi:uridine phosphorylase
MTDRSSEPSPILRIRAADVPESVIVVGDPHRAEAIAARLDDVTELGRYREYWTFRGHHRGVPVAVASHGVGSGGATICFEELCRAGAKRIIRVGTAGGLQNHIFDGHVVIATAAVRDDGVTERIVPLAYPAVPSLDLTMTLRQRAQRATIDSHEGVVLSSALFYPHPVLGNQLAMWQRAGVVAIEQECAALFIIAGQYQIQSAAILTIDGNPLADHGEDMTDYDPHRSLVADAVETAAAIALDTVTLTA